MQFLPCYPRVCPTMNTVSDKQSVPAAGSPRHELEACPGPNLCFCMNRSILDSRRASPAATEEPYSVFSISRGYISRTLDGGNDLSASYS